MSAYITQDERLRRIGELLFRGVYLWSQATETTAEARQVNLDVEAIGDGTVDQDGLHGPAADLPSGARVPRRAAPRMARNPRRRQPEPPPR